jgi:hypothetical protein
VNRLITRDPASGDELIVTRMWCPTSQVSIEGQFSLGWLGKLTPDQLDFVGLLLRSRNNLQRLAAELGVSYSTARSRLDEIVAALGGPLDTVLQPDDDLSPPGTPNEQTQRAHTHRRLQALEALAGGAISHQEAVQRLRDAGRGR